MWESESVSECVRASPTAWLQCSTSQGVPIPLFQNLSTKYPNLFETFLDNYTVYPLITIQIRVNLTQVSHSHTLPLSLPHSLTCYLLA